MEFLQDLLPAPTKAIVTTRHRLDVAYPVRLSGMPRNDAEQLINQEYTKTYTEYYGSLKIISAGMNTPFKLDEIYTDVQLFSRLSLHYYESIDALEELYRGSSDRDSIFHGAERKNGIELANEQQYLMVLGGPGCGKSTFLQKIGLEALRNSTRINDSQSSFTLQKSSECSYVHDCIPVMLKLRDIDWNTSKIEDVIAQKFEISDFQKAKELTNLLLRKGKLLILLDGLDEIPVDVYSRATTQVENLVNLYDGNRFIASCRTAAYKIEKFKCFYEVTIAAFDNYQIKGFINNWFQKERETAQRLWKILNSKDYQAVKELAQTPLLLVLLCAVYERNLDLPKNRSLLYSHALSIMLKDWPTEKRTELPPIYRELGSDLIESLLSEIAYANFIENHFFFSKSTLMEQIRNFLVANLSVPEYFDADQVLKSIEIQQSILVEHSRNIYSFSYLTFQEYLTALYIVDNQSIEELVENYLIDERWREIFVLVAGLIRGKKRPTRFLLMIESGAQEILLSSNIVRLLNWIESVIDYSSDASLLIKRLTALYIAISLVVSPKYAQN